MANFAQLDQSNTVINVVVLNNSDIEVDGIEDEAKGIALCQKLFGANTQWRQTSYSAKFRKNYAGTGYKYNVDLDAFIAPQPYPSWSLNAASCQWQAPKPYPSDGKAYSWDESLLRWVAAPFQVR